VPQIGTRVGKADNPIGACVNCGCLTCDEHGYWDPKPAFVCIQCDAALQAGCAGWVAWQLQQSGQAVRPSGGGSSAGALAYGDETAETVGAGRRGRSHPVSSPRSGESCWTVTAGSFLLPRWCSPS
jgi:hypothetical protein